MNNKQRKKARKKKLIKRVVKGSLSMSNIWSSEFVDVESVEVKFKRKNDIKYIRYKNDMMVNKIFLYDPLGNLTTVKLTEIETNNGVSDSLFEFKTPEGAEVVKPPSFP